MIGTYEEKIAMLEQAKARFADQLTKRAEPKGSFSGNLEPVLDFLAIPWKLSRDGQIALLRMAIADRLHSCRNEGARPPEIAFPLRALGRLEGLQVRDGALHRTNLEHLF